MNRNHREQCRQRGRQLAHSVLRLMVATLAGAAVLTAQSLLQSLTTAGVQQNGLRIYDISGYSGYSTVDTSSLAKIFGPSNQNGPDHTITSGASTALGFNKHSEKVDFSVMYSVSYEHQTYGTSWNSLSHTTALSWSRKLAPKWRFNITASGIAGNFNQMLFSATTLQSIASLPGTFEDVAGAVLTGQSTNPDLATAATSATATVSPQQRLIYGDRMISANAVAGLSYSISPRFSMGVSLSGSRMQHLNQQGNSADQGAYLLPQDTSVSGGFSIDYRLSPRTSMTASVNHGRSISSLNDAQYDSLQAGLGRKLTERWFVQGSVGGGYIRPGNQSYSTRGSQWQTAGTIGYRVRSQTIIASTYRGVSDYYGLATGAMMGTTGAWAWKRPGSNWGVQAGISQSRLLGNTLGNDGFRISAGVNRMLSRGTSMILQYAYASFSGNLIDRTGIVTASRFQFKQHSIRLSMAWGPGAGSLGTSAGGGTAAGQTGR
jgi:hypothetical protein